MKFQANDIIGGKYVLLEYIGKGSFAEVWSVYEVNENINKRYALKLFNSNDRIDKNEREDFESEYDKAKSFNNEHILSPINQGIHEGINPYLVMPLCKGSLMDEFKEKNRASGFQKAFEEKELLIILNHIASALDATYYKEVIHMDVKPQNILIFEEKDEDGYVHRTKYMLTDFGISKHIGDTIRKTQSLLNEESKSSSSMSPAYAAPERYAGSASYKSDIFSLGVTLFEMSEGHLPLKDGVDSFGKILLDRPNTIVPELKDYSNEFKSLISSCIQRDESNRPTPSKLVIETDKLLKINTSDNDWGLIQLLKSYWKEFALGTIIILIFMIIGYYFLSGNPIEEANRLQKAGQFQEAAKCLSGIDSLKIRSGKLRKAAITYTKIRPYNNELSIVERGGRKGLINWEIEEIQGGCIYTNLVAADDNEYFIYEIKNREKGVFDNNGEKHKANSEIKSMETQNNGKIRITLNQSTTSITLDYVEFIRTYCNE
jgi:serine/threonine protein kinase